MSRLIEVQTQLLETNTAISEVEASIGSNADSIALQAAAASILKRQKELEVEFLDIVNSRGEDVCSYRLLTERPKASLNTLTNSLNTFQKLFSIVYEAIKKGRRDKYSLSAESATTTSFDFGYTFAGSIGVVLTIPNERLILMDSDLDKTIQMISNMANCVSADDVLEFAQGLGTAPIESMSKWACSHADFAVGARITWHRGSELRSSLLVDLPSFERIRDIIAETSESEEEELVVEGLLVGADISSGSFHIQLSDESDLRGKFSDAISRSHTVELPRRYRARLRKTTVTIFSTNKQHIEYFLLELDSLES